MSTTSESTITSTSEHAITGTGGHAVAELAPDACDVWLEQLDVSDATRRSYSAGISRWRSWLEVQGLDVLHAANSDVRRYRDGLTEAGLKPGTVNAYLAAVKGLYKWLDAQGAYPDIARDVRRVRTDGQGARDALTVSQAREVLDERPTDLRGLRDAAIVSLTLYCGLRTIEVSRADVGDLRQTGGRLVIWVQGKGRQAKDRFVNVEAEPEAALRRYLTARSEVSEVSEHDPLFTSCSDRNAGGRLTTRTISGIIKSRLRECGLDSDRLTAHSLRHTAVTFALLGGADVTEVQAMARHADVGTTMTYAHAIDRSEAVPERAVADYIRTGTRKRAS